MNNNQERLREEVKDRLEKSFSELNTELNELQNQRLLSSLDRKKIMADAEISARAVRDALERTDYPEQMQRELIMRLIVQFENSVKDIASKSRSKVYDSKFIHQRLSEIEKSVLKNLGIAIDKQSKIETSDWKRARDSYVTRIKDLSKAKNLDVSQINYAYQDYEKAYRDYASQFLPKIETRANQDFSPNVRPVPPRQSKPPVKPTQSPPPVTPKHNVPPSNQQVSNFYKEKARPEKKTNFVDEENDYADSQQAPAPKRKALLRLVLIGAILLILIFYICSFTTWLPRFIFHIIRFIF